VADLKLTAGGDLALVAGDLALTSDPDGETIAQRVAIRLRWFYGEWFLDTRKGVKYRERVMVKNPNMAEIETMLSTTILETPGIVSLDRYSQTLDRATRRLSVSYRATADNGAIIDETEVLSP
jgi:hypothetical protein